MKAREIKVSMLKQYDQEIANWHRDLLRVEGREIRIRNLEANLQNYFGVLKKFRFDEGKLKVDVPF